MVSLSKKPAKSPVFLLSVATGGCFGVLTVFLIVQGSCVFIWSLLHIKIIYCGPLKDWPSGLAIEVPLRKKFFRRTTPSPEPARSRTPILVQHDEILSAAETLAALSSAPPSPGLDQGAISHILSAAETLAALSSNPPSPLLDKEASWPSLPRDFELFDTAVASRVVSPALSLVSNAPSPIVNIEVDTVQTSALRTVRLPKRREESPSYQSPAVCRGPPRPLKDSEIENVLFYGKYLL
ncbi:uncharacterized protein LOC134800294 [Cydia splendana]|uniref:uncharacterized protein LOC134800294 n=1 Tax=Cydia splendana TaxID=1100963 RepID=UPI00300D768C